MTIALAALLAAGVLAPHGVNLDAARPLAAATVWAASLALRALICALAAVAVVLYLPGLATFTAISRGCWHAGIPGIPQHVVVSGHRLGDVALVVPASLLLVSLAWGVVGVLRAARSLRQRLGRPVGVGPRASSIYPDDSVVLAATGLIRPRVVVSAGALVALDDDELAAGLDHEQGHISRRHQWILLLGGLCRDMGRAVPGSALAEQELRHHLERDADAFALRASSRETLARAICKAAVGPGPGPTRGTDASLGGGSTVRRVRLLAEPPGPTRRHARVGSALALSMVIVALAGSVFLAASADRALATVDGAVSAAPCDHALATGER